MLIGAGLACKIKNLKLIDIPLNFYKIDEQFKLYFADISLIMPSYGKIAQEILLNGNSGIYKVAICENAICSLLKAKNLNISYYQKPV